MNAAPPPLLLDFTSAAGTLAPALNDELGELGPLRERFAWLRIRSDITGFVPPTFSPEDDELTGFVPPVFEDDGLALLATTGGAPGGRVGLCHARLVPDDIEALRRVIEDLPWRELPRAGAADRYAPTLRLGYAGGSTRIRRVIHASDDALMAALDPVIRHLGAVAARAQRNVASGLELRVEARGSEQSPDADAPQAGVPLTLSVRLRATGIGHLALNDPRLPSRPPRLQVRASLQTGARPRWTELPLPAAETQTQTQTATSARVLAPRRSIELTVPWTPPAPGRYLVEARWRDYAGPERPVPGQTPFMPLPATGASSLGSGPYPIRGSLQDRTTVEVQG